MAITLGVGPSAGAAAPGSSFDITLTGTTSGRGVVILILWQDDGGTRTISSVTVGAQSATVVAGSKATAVSGVDYTQIAFLNNLTSGGDKTITVTMSGSVYGTGVAVEVVGLDTTAAVDNSTSFSDDFALLSTSLTTNTNNCAIFAVCTANDSNEPTAGTNFTLLSNPRANNGYRDEDEYWLDSGSAGAKTVSFGNVAGDGWVILSAISVKVPAAAGRTTKNTRGWGLGTELGMGIWMPNEL